MTDPNWKPQPGKPAMTCDEIMCNDEKLAKALGWRFSPAHDGWINEQHRDAHGDGWGS